LSLPVLWVDKVALREVVLRSANSGISGVWHVTRNGIGVSFQSALAYVAHTLGYGAKEAGGTIVELLGQSGSGRVVREPVSSFGLSSQVGGESELRVWLLELLGLQSLGVLADDLRVVSTPSAGLSGADKSRLLGLQSLGDAVLTTVIFERCVLAGGDAEACQVMRGTLASNSELSRLYAAKVPKGVVAFPSGVNPGVGKVGASTLEGFIGLLYLTGGVKVARDFVSAIGVWG